VLVVRTGAVGSLSAPMVTVLMPLPAADFDPTEAAVTWQVLSAAGHEVVFATPSGQPGQADDLMVTGRGLDPWGAIPGLRRLTVVGRVLRADAEARRAYAALVQDQAFASPLHWGAARRSRYDALVLPGGHRARGMRPYLESAEVQQMAIDAFRAGKPVGAICHGVLVAARAVDPVTGRSALHGRRTTALTWALEQKAWSIARWSRFWDSSYYRTYMEEPGQRWGYMSVQQEVTRALADPADFADVEKGTPDWRRKTSGRARDTSDDDRPAWVVRDGSYVSARWPGDVHTFAKTFAEVLGELS
jgi:putative intracellular protease/amidase